jgi:hypothetical protein
LLLAKRYSDRGNFAGYSWKDDMICEAVMTCIKYMHNFKTVNIENPNPFAYFSRIIHNSFLNYIAKQKTHRKIKDICYKNIDFITPDAKEDDWQNFDICAIDYQQSGGIRRKRERKLKKLKKREFVKRLIVTDTHLGLYSDSDIWLDIVLNFFKHIVKYCVKNDIKELTIWVISLTTGNL